MAIFFDKDLNEELVKQLSKAALIAAATAPKGKGIDRLRLAWIDGDEKAQLAEQMATLGKLHGQEFFLRDAENVRNSAAVLLAGTNTIPRELHYCGLCGMLNCENKAKQPNVPCVFNLIDLGIAIGSAVSKLMDLRIDNRIMYTAGMAALEMKLLGEDVRIALGIPVSASSKNIFFDRVKK